MTRVQQVAKDLSATLRELLDNPSTKSALCTLRARTVATNLAAVSVKQWLDNPNQEALMRRIAEELCLLPEFQPSPFRKYQEGFREYQEGQ